MRNALAVSLTDGYAWRTVTQYAEDVRFSKQVPGGYFDASFTLRMPTRTFTDLGSADRCALTDKRTGAPVWDGYTRNPTPQTGRTGQLWQVSAVGGSVVASDQAMPLVYIDSEYGYWIPGVGPASSVTSMVADAPEGAPTGVGDQGVIAQFNAGQPVGPNYWVGSRYHALRDLGTNMTVGTIALTVTCGKTDTGYRNVLVTNDLQGNIPSTVVQSSTNINTSVITNVYWAGLGTAGPFVHPSNEAVIFALRLYRTGGATNVADDSTWAYYSNITVTGRRLDRYGVRVAPGPAGQGSATYTLASWVVEDLLGRLLTMCDSTTAVVDPSTFQINQLTYPTGAKASQILDDLVNLYEPNMLWEVGRTLPNGLHTFAFRTWPTTPRYLLGDDVDFDVQGSDTDLANRVIVTWTDNTGRPFTRAFGQEVLALGVGSPVLDNGNRNPAYTGRVVDAPPVELPVGRGSLPNATQIAAQILASTSGTAPPSAKATFDTPIVDRLTNRRVEPHEVEPGHVALRVSTGDQLRVTNVDYTDTDGVANLDLGIPSLTVDQQVAQLAKVR